MSEYRDPTGPELPETETEPVVSPDDLPGSEDDDDGEEYVPLDDEPSEQREDAESSGEANPDRPPTPGAFAAPPPE